MKSFSRLWQSLRCVCHKYHHHTFWRGWTRLMLPLMTLAAIAWFLVRVIPKPIRATYPCQRAAFPIATALVIWLLGFKTGLIAWWISIRARAFRPIMGIFAVCLFAALAVSVGRLSADYTANKGGSGWQPVDPPNTPKGVGKGVFPGRVVWMRDTNATPWNGTSGTWWAEGTGVRQASVDRMFSTTLQALTAATNESQAWTKIFQQFNATHSRGAVGYQAGETIAIKINCNNSYDGYVDADNHANASPQAVLAVLRQLVNKAGVPQDKIVVYEAVRVVPDCIYDPCHEEFPGVLWADSQGTGSNGRQPLNWRTNVLTYSRANDFGRNLPELVYQATYLINMAILKGHWRAGVTLTAKNHFGSINLVNANNAHLNSIHSYTLGMDVYHPFVDLIGSQHLGGKTILFLIDGLYGTREVQSYVDTAGDSRWYNLFNGKWSASLFASLDPVAIDSVGLDFLRSEFGDTLATGHNANADAYMHEAATADVPASGTDYRPNGVRLASLGAHEHWNNAAAKQYSRNLGNPAGIELLKFEASQRAAVVLVNPGSASTHYEGRQIPLLAAVTAGNSPLQKVEFYRGTTLVGTSASLPFSCTWVAGPLGPSELKAVAWDTSGLSSTSAVVHVTIKPLPPPPNILDAQIVGDGISIRFGSISGLTYRVETALSPEASEWAPVGAAQVASNTITTILDTRQGKQKYYRAVCLP